MSTYGKYGINWLTPDICCAAPVVTSHPVKFQPVADGGVAACNKACDEMQVFLLAKIDLL
jgi:hypothetical protein